MGKEGVPRPTSLDASGSSYHEPENTRLSVRPACFLSLGVGRPPSVSSPSPHGFHEPPRSPGLVLQFSSRALVCTALLLKGDFQKANHVVGDTRVWGTFGERFPGRVNTCIEGHLSDLEKSSNHRWDLASPLLWTRDPCKENSIFALDACSSPMDLKKNLVHAAQLRNLLTCPVQIRLVIICPQGLCYGDTHHGPFSAFLIHEKVPDWAKPRPK